MTVSITPLSPTDITPIEDAGLGCLRTERGNLPLTGIDAHVSITGLVARTEQSQTFHNPYDVPLEATYIFPLPARAAVTALRMEADGHTVEAELRERADARAAYDEAVASGRRAAIAEQERPDVFTMRVGNIVPGESVTVRISLVGPLPYADGEAEYRLPLVVAPRYIPGNPLPGPSVGDGVVPDTDAVPDASRITPPVLLPGFPNPVALSITADIHPGGLPLASARSSLHAVRQSVADGVTRLDLEPGERVDRDFVLRLAYGTDAVTTSLILEPDSGPESRDGTFQLTVLPPVDAAPPRPRDVVLVLDRSGSMEGWKMVAARRAAARIVDTLTDGDRFAALTFDSVVEHPAGLPAGLVPATDRHRFRAVEHLAGVSARGGTEILSPLREAAALLTDPERDRVLILVTDGQIGNEDQIITELTTSLNGIRVHTIGIDRAVNAGFLGSLAAIGRGRCELVESEDRLDEATERIHRRIGAPLLTDVALKADFAVIDDSITPSRLPDAFPGVPLVIRGRYNASVQYAAPPAIQLAGITPAGDRSTVDVVGTPSAGDTLAPAWARGHLRDLEDKYVANAQDRSTLERRMIAVSLRHTVLCRFTAFVAVDSRVVAGGTPTHRVIQPVELPSGWDPAILAGAAPAAPVGLSFTAPGQMFAAPGQMFASAGQMRPGRPARRRAGGLAGRARDSAAVDIRPLLAEELTGLRTNAGPEAERLHVLADLGSRLEALVRAAAGQLEPAALVALRELAEALARCAGPTPPRGGDLDALWRHALDTLTALVGGEPRRTFWKRSP